MEVNNRTNIFFIDHATSTKSGMHDQLEKAARRNIIFPTYRFQSTIIFKFLFKIKRFPWASYLISSRLFGKWKRKLRKEKKSINKIIVTANYLTIDVVKWINKKYPEIDVHVYYFNILSKDVPISYFKKLNCKIWTFDMKDANENKLGLANFPLPKENFNTLPTVNEYKSDAIFIGADKGRLQEILSIKKILNDNGLVTKFHIVATFGEDKLNDYSYEKSLSYEEILTMTNYSKTIVDIVQNGQTGGTIRTIEALFFKKKLITNNLSVIDEPYYDNRNIFIIGKDDETKLYSFVSSPYQRTNYNVQQHELMDWLVSF